LAPEDAHNRYEHRRQELQVRLTAQRILTAHLNPDAAEVYWADIDLNLTEAHLHQLDLTACHLRNAQFNGATFTGTARFGGATFTGNMQFGGARVFPPRRVVLPRGWITRAAQAADREEDGWLYVVRDERIRAEQPAEAPDNDGEGGERWRDGIMTWRSKGAPTASDTGRANGTLATRG
jgi:hypothetical protein